MRLAIFSSLYHPPLEYMLPFSHRFSISDTVKYLLKRGIIYSAGIMFPKRGIF
ncbi:hypothetical protein TREPR_1598 [Treponema primitia ZAS-2]|uniref:Uncharacterized protein n=1 Tax=Treponema primitia (strain ATCC BAA-887 / DSM 12427 / ZAS-2) TaxID=545694 RepID=F5YNU4_TREPZ|nr:hypothetical protein TREPR_1598 [Treponema primitia ZAS-2]